MNEKRKTVIGRRVLCFDAIDSTNARALALADDPDNDGLVLLAREQTSGRGQRGRTWTAPADSSVLMSVLIYPPAPLRRPAILTAWATVCVCRLIHQLTGLDPRIKWPNDVLIQERKVCGILIEQRSQSPQRKQGPKQSPQRKQGFIDRLATVAGIGLNVRQEAEWFTAAGLPQAASLAVFSKKSFECRHLADLLIQHLDEEYARLQQGELTGLEADWKRFLGLIGQTVLLERINGSRRGRLRDITFRHVALECFGEKIETCKPEDICQLVFDNRIIPSNP